MIDYKKCNKEQLKYEFERLAALSKYKPTFGVFDIFSKLPDLLNINEQPLCVNAGLVKSNVWLVVPTDLRLIFIHKKPGFLHKKIESSFISYENITSVDSSSGFTGGKIIISTAGMKYEINKLSKDSVSPLVSTILNRKHNTETQKKPDIESASQDDLLLKLEKLGELKEKGILTEEEFKEQKARLIS
ncbi:MULTISPECIES: PH domain-containing protein [unclassified Providencia]|uniref:PH domain-containing protein n=1 Tax=unclassified Providencia TaxID=2633465 RepID=UPI00234B2550|nr:MULTISPECIES: PH domain-containing protein [unclassified Providencia]